MSAIPQPLAAEASDAGRVDPRVWRVAPVVFLAPLMAQMDSTVVNVSLSTIGVDLHTPLHTVQWIISGYLLALALMLPLNAWLVDRLGAKRLYLFCFTAFTLASLLCGAATSIGMLIAARVLQGIAGGLLTPMTQLMIARVAGRHMARVMGYTAMPILLAPILGPVVAGAILKYAAWPWLFYINLPLGVLAVALAWFLLPADEAASQRRGFDFLGFFLISPGLAALLYGLDHVPDAEGYVVLAAGLALMVVFAWHALRKGDAALLDLRLFNNRIFTAAATTQFISNGVIFAGQVLLPLYLIAGQQFSPAQAGWLLAPMGLGMFCTYPFLGFLTEKFGCRPVAMGGTLLAIAGTVPFFWMIEGHFSPLLLGVCLAMRGAGQGGVGIPSVSAAYASVPKEKLALATTAANIVQRLGGPISTTALTLLLSSMAGSEAPLTTLGPHAFLIAFGALLALHLLVLTSASRLPLRIHPTAA